MKNNTTFKKVFKIFLLGFIVISSIYGLYFYNNNNNNNNILENFSNCSNCKLNPSSNKCKPIYNIDYKWNSKKNMVNINNIETDYVLCEWEPNCSYASTGNNILTQEERLGLSNAQLQKALI